MLIVGRESMGAKRTGTGAIIACCLVVWINPLPRVKSAFPHSLHLG